MNVNKDIIKTFSPCESGFTNYLKHYEGFNGSFDDFLDLEQVPYQDKIWLAKKMLNKNQLVHFGLFCAESVLEIFENKYPEDKNISNAFKFFKTIKDFGNLSASNKQDIIKHRENISSSRRRTAAAYTATYAAAYATDAAAYATDAAAYATYAAAYATDAAAYADYAAAYTDYAADAATDAAYYAADAAARKKQEFLNLQLLKMAASL